MPRRFFFSSHHSVGMAVGAGETDGAAVVGDAEGAGEGETDGAAVVGDAVGAGEIVGAGVVGAGVGAQPPATCVTPHDVEEHPLWVNALPMFTSSSTHQPRSWSKAEAWANMELIAVTLSTCQLPSGWLNDEAFQNIERIVVAPEVSHAVMSSLKDAAYAALGQ
jgi:hypothetical protein